VWRAAAVELVLLNKHQILGGGAYLDCYPITNLARVSFCAGVAGVVFLYIVIFPPPTFSRAMARVRASV